MKPWCTPGLIHLKIIVIQVGEQLCWDLYQVRSHYFTQKFKLIICVSALWWWYPFRSLYGLLCSLGGETAGKVKNVLVDYFVMSLEDTVEQTVEKQPKLECIPRNGHIVWDLLWFIVVCYWSIALLFFRNTLLALEQSYGCQTCIVWPSLWPYIHNARHKQHTGYRRIETQLLILNSVYDNRESSCHFVRWVRFMGTFCPSYGSCWVKGQCRIAYFMSSTCVLVFHSGIKFP